MSDVSSTVLPALYSPTTPTRDSVVFTRKILMCTPSPTPGPSLKGGEEEPVFLPSLQGGAGGGYP